MSEQLKLYKVLTAEGESMHGGSLKWSLPRKRGKGYTPGKWHETDGEIAVCSNGLHLTTQPGKWWKWNATVWEAQGDGECDTDGDKIAFRRARLLKPAQEPAYISKAKEFIATIPSVKWFTPDSPPDPTWKVFATRAAARAAAGDARLMVLVGSICFDLNIDSKHREHARARWDVWQRGYGLLCDVNGIFYVYEKVA